MEKEDEISSAMVRSTHLWRLGDRTQALKLLDDSIAEAARKNQTDWARGLSRHAALMCRLDGDLLSARLYSEQALTYGSDNPTALLGMATILLEQGEGEFAREYAAKCYDISLRGGTELDRSRIELIIRLWPELDTRLRE